MRIVAVALALLVISSVSLSNARDGGAIGAQVAAAQSTAESAAPQSTPEALPLFGALIVIQPGQEDLLAEMLGKGAALPEGCKLTEGKIERDRVHATYSCPQGEAVFVLTHPSAPSSQAVTTERFALALERGTPPESLAPELATRIRARESAFQWKTIGEPRRFPRSIIVVAGVVLLAIVGWVLRRRANHPRN